jgi:hypothetical protein
MNLLTRLTGLISGTEDIGEPRISVFGDSHTAALTQGRDFPARKHQYEHIDVTRVLKEKNGRAIGDATLAAFCRDIQRFRSNDFVFSAVGGNQYAVISTVRHRIEYDFLLSPLDRCVASDDAELVPFRALAGYVNHGIRGSVGPVLRDIRNSTVAKVFHLAPPPPKEDNDFIATHFEGRFAGEGLKQFGPTSPELRLKCWNVQLQCLRNLCEELEIGLVDPPTKALTSAGYLDPRCYATDVTHANRRYGEYVLRQIVEITGTENRAGGPAS